MTTKILTTAFALSTILAAGAFAQDTSAVKADHQQLKADRQEVKGRQGQAEGRPRGAP
jgi:hypothetical protein